MTATRFRSASGAIISADGRYRYALWRPLDDPAGGSGTLLFVMLNPSTADATHNDNTIRACKRIAQANHYARLLVGNLYAWRSRDPGGLWKADDPVGPDWAEWMDVLLCEANIVVAGWGAYAPAARGQEVLDFIRITRQVFCLGRNFNGSPKHPLFLKTDQPLEPL